MLSRFILVMLLVWLHVPGAQGQPVNTLPDGQVTAEVPAEILVERDGHCRIVTRTIGPMLQAELANALPRRVQIVSIGEGGQRWDGFLAKNRTGMATHSLAFSRPDAIEFSPDAGYTISWMINVSRSDAAPIAPGEEWVLPAWGVVPVRYEGQRQSQPRVDRGPDFELIYNPIGVPPLFQPEVDQILFNVKRRLERILEGSRGQVFIDVVFAPGPIVAFTEVGVTIRNFPATRSLLIQQVFLDGLLYDQADDENMYFNLPSGNSMPVVRTFPLPETASNVQIPVSMIPQLFISQSRTPPDATITVNSSIPLDYFTGDGISADRYDLEYIITHETIHALGFETRIEQPINTNDQNAQQLVDSLMLLDMFRFRTNSFSSMSIPPTIFMTSPRMLAVGEEAFTTTRLNSGNRSYDMSTGVGGDGFGAQHWKDGFGIGVMDPKVLPGLSAGTPGYVFEADAHALDAIGWLVQFPIANFAPAPCVPTTPASGAINLPLHPTLGWDVGIGTESINLAVYEGPVPQDERRVYFASGLPPTTTTHVVPENVLSQNRLYNWQVISVTGTPNTGVEVALGPVRLFTTLCVADFNQSGDVSVQDVFDFLTAWFNNCTQPAPPNCLANADVNGDGSVGVQDVFDFLTFWFAGCV